jgi:hypothetical protein
MKCAACGNENQPSAKFCVHCGVLLAPVSSSAPVPVAAMAGVAAPVAPTPAASAPAPRPTLAPVAPPPPVASPSPIAPPMSAGEPASPSPAPSRTPLIIGAVALVVVAAAGYLGYRALYGGSKPEPVAVAEPPKPAEAPTPPAAVEPAKDANTLGVAATDATQSTAQAPSKSATATGANAAPEILPDTPAAPPKPRRQPKPVPTAEPVTTEPTASAPAPPAKAPAKAVAAVATPAPVQTDRWQMYADAMGRCAREDFFKRLGCELRTRNQYCQGYWGQVPQCPEATPRERGQ